MHVCEWRTEPSTPLIHTNIALPNNPQLAQKEGRIALALQVFKQGQFSSLRTAIYIYDIPESILRRYIKGINTRYDSILVNRKLTTTEELILIE